MIKKIVKLENMRQVEKFNAICSKFTCDMDLKKGKFYVDAKSIMGIFSLKLDGPVELIADTDDEDIIERDFRDFIINK